MSERKRVVIYTRVSRDDSGEGKSNERQEAEARRLCEYKRWDVVEVVADISVSAAGKVKRPGWDRVLAMIANSEIDYVVAYAMDRMTRNMLDLERLIVLCEDHGVGIATVDGDIDLTSEMGRMIARILAAVARAEIEIKARRQKLANADRASKGEAHSGGVRPFGYENDRLTIVPKEADAIRKAAAEVLAGVPLAVVAKKWTDAGLVSSRAMKTIEKRAEKGDDRVARPKYDGWTAQGVKGVLTNPRYAGIRLYNGEKVGAGKWRPILDLETHLRLVEHLNDPGRSRGRVKTGRTPTSLLTGIMECEVCGNKMRAASIKSQLTYSCRNGCCQIDRAEADNYILGRVIAELSQPGWIKHLAASSGDGDDLVEAKRIVDEQEAARVEYAEMLASGAMDLAQFKAATVRSRQLSEQAEATLAKARRGETMQGLALGTNDVKNQILALPLERQRALVQKVVRCSVKQQNRNRRDLWPVDVRITVASNR